MKRVIKHLYQPCGLSCGNAVLKMLLNYYGICNNLSIPDLIKICNTDAATGTTDKNLIQGLEHTKIPYEQNSVTDDNKALSILKNRLKNEFFLMRALTKNIPHWILVNNYNESTKLFNVLDPWLGEITYNDQEIINIWKPRNYDGFYVPQLLNNNYKISKVN